MEQSEQINDLAAALAKAQGEIKGAAKDSTNPHFKSRYADLASVWEACRAALSKAGLSVIQTPDTTADGLFLYTTLAHASGQWIRGVFPVQPTQNTPQGIGSALTYARRYSLAAMVGVAPDDDDDGNGASAAKPVQAVAGAAPAAVKTAAPKHEPAWRKHAEHLKKSIDESQTVDELNELLHWPEWDEIKVESKSAWEFLDKRFAARLEVLQRVLEGAA